MCFIIVDGIWVVVCIVVFRLCFLRDTVGFLFFIFVLVGIYIWREVILDFVEGVGVIDDLVEFGFNYFGFIYERKINFYFYVSYRYFGFLLFVVKFIF